MCPMNLYARCFYRKSSVASDTNKNLNKEKVILVNALNFLVFWMRDLIRILIIIGKYLSSYQ